ncbi:hypothetical protein H9L06_08610 [Leucobacter denitrificans]|uniref:Fibronectin type-III domain-containing protein n=1 Tax=Leucobacter denitrificans TaxID=683042 RepID=A0A7G9S815_9MICO|nr:hypothetical protein H9L06_08610 [Leucobacter denitrificans]
MAGGAVTALVVTIAIISSGFDAQEVERKEPNVWVTREAGQYARVNTETGEIDTVRKVVEPSGVLQIGSESVVLANGNGNAWPVNAAKPEDFVESAGSAGAAPENESDATAETVSQSSEATEAVRMPDGTRDVITAGNSVLLRTEDGAVFVGTIAETGAVGGNPDLAWRLQAMEQIDPLADEAAEARAAAEAESEATDTEAAETEVLGFRASAIALAPNGIAAMYSATDGTIWRYDTVRSEFVGDAIEVPEAAAQLESAQLALVAGDWVLLDGETGALWREGGESVTLELEGAGVLQASGEGDGPGAGGGSAALVADISGLWRVSQQGNAERIAEAEGTPSQPRSVGGVRFAAWIGQSDGTLWSSESDTRVLEFDASATDLGEVNPVVYTNGDRAVLGETRTGMLWTLPEGNLIPLSQWTISDPPKEDQGTVVVEEVTTEVAPTAVNDEFGVRAGEPAPLPVLLNDFDANKRDVLTIVPDSLGENALPEEFGVIELAPDGQSLMIRPNADASGTASFTYRLTDGGLTSAPATVTVSAVDEERNTAPAWCPVDGCQRTWAVPPLTPGGTLVYPILEGWVDPEGDPMLLTAVETLRPEDPATALVTADGRLAVRHTDVNAGASEVMLRLTVRDGKSAEHKRDLQISVQPGAAAEFSPMASTIEVGSPTRLTPLDRVAGGSGSFQLVDVNLQSGTDRVKANAKTSNNSIEVTASAAGEAMLSVGLRDTVTGAEFSGLIRVTANPSSAPLTLPPLRAFVRPLSDTTVEILDAIPGSSSRALSVQSATVVDGELRADVIEHARVRVAGSTSDGAAGRIGSIDVTVAEGSVGAQGRLTVFQVDENSAAGAIAVADSATVRAGSVVDIRVLDNDVAAPGERLILHPQVTGSGTSGELAFASGSTLRYLAPKQPGTYRLSYTTYGASNPAAGDVGTVTVTVLPSGANQDPQPATVTTRVAAGEQSQVQVPLSGVDPDGDRVRLIGVNPIDTPQLSASIAASGTAIAVAASPQAEPGLTTVNYTVRDGQGGSAEGQLRIIVTAANNDAGAPIASSDYVRIAVGAEEPVVVRPLDNDIDPANGQLEILEIVPNVPGGQAHPDYARLLDRLDISKLKRGLISITPGDELGTVSYRYTVQSSETSSTADGLLLVQTSERVGAQAPTVTDTVLNVRERSELSAGGVDVITDKIRWSAGDPAALDLSLWGGNNDGYRVSGNNIVGEYNPNGDLVAFKLAGIDASGAEVTSYGFLIIPPLDELRVTLKPGLSPLSVDENKSVSAKVRSLLDLTQSDRVEVSQERFPVGRSNATCEAVSAEEIRYTAGAEGPWEDTCLISVRLVGQKNWTQLPVAVIVVPRAPVVQLGALTRTVAPGTSETIDLLDMVNWQGNREGDVSKLAFSVTGGGSLFERSQSGSSLTVTARADGVPGSQDGLTVSVTGEGQSQAPLTLRIGEAPKDQPRGGTVNLTCTVGSSCGTDVIGAPGEYDPFAGKTGGGLTLDTVNSTGCSYGTVSKASDRGVTVAWPDNRGPGGKCTVGYTVRDAQDRVGSGSIEFDAQGVPRAPASLTPQSYSGNSITFVVELGAAQSAHPSLTGVEVTGAGSSTCSPAGPASYQCVVSGLENGSQHQFVARAINAVGKSDPSSPATAWAYKTPNPPTISNLRSVPGNEVTQSQGVIEFDLAGEHDVAGYRVSVGGVTQEFSGRNVHGKLTVPIGGQNFSVVSLSKHQPPKGLPGEGRAANETVNVAGKPVAGSLIIESPDRNTLTAQMSGANSSFSTNELRYSYQIKRNGFPDACPTDYNSYGMAKVTFSELRNYNQHNIRACVHNGYGFDEVSGFGYPGLTGGGTVPVPSGQLSFSIGTAAPTPPVTQGSYLVTSEASPVADEGAVLQYETGGVISSSFTHSQDSAADIRVRQCFDTSDETSCSAWHTLTWTGAPTVVSAQLTGACVPEGNAAVDVVNISSAAAPFASVVGNEATGELKITWGGSFSALAPLVLQGTGCNPPPEPEPEPEPTP